MVQDTFYTAVEIDGFWHAKIYRYLPDGNTMKTIWRSDQTYNTKNEAIDAACEFAEMHGIDANLD